MLAKYFVSESYVMQVGLRCLEFVIMRTLIFL